MRLEELSTLRLTKLLGMILTAGFAAYGLVFDFKKDGRVTRHGRIAIVGIGVSTCISVCLLLVESRGAKSERIELRQERARQVLTKAEIEVLLARFSAMKDSIEAASVRLQSRFDSASERMTHRLDSQLSQGRLLKQELIARGHQAAASLGSLRGALTDFDGAVSRSLARLERPLQAMSFLRRLLPQVFELTCSLNVRGPH